MRVAKVCGQIGRKCAGFDPDAGEMGRFSVVQDPQGGVLL